jgi:hypothetical protein
VSTPPIDWSIFFPISVWGPQQPQRPAPLDPAGSRDCNPTGDATTEMKLGFITSFYSGALAEANQVQADLRHINSNLNINTSALAVMFLQWSSRESRYATNAANVAENNYFGMQQGWAGSIPCPDNPNIPGNTKNACFPTSLTWGQELGVALNGVSSKTGATYLSALESAFASGAGVSGGLQAIANNGWNGSPTYGSDITSQQKIQAQISCLKDNGSIP